MTKSTLFALLILSVYANAQPGWEKSYVMNLPNVPKANCIIKTNDGGYLIDALGPAAVQIYYHPRCLIKLNSNGDTSWTKTYAWLGSYTSGGPIPEESVQQTSDGGYVVIGTDTSLMNCWNCFLLVKLDQNGDTLWTKSYEHNTGVGDNGGYCVIQTSDGGYVAAGAFQSPGHNNYGVVKTDANGNELYRKTIFSTTTAIGLHPPAGIKQSSNGDFIIAGHEWAGADSTILIRIDPLFNPVWTRLIKMPFLDAFAQTADSGFVLVSRAWGGPPWPFQMTKTDGNGNILWTKMYSEESGTWVYSVHATIDGGLALTGWINNDAYLLKTDANGIKLWSKKYGNVMNSDWGNSIQQTNDGGFIIAGETDDIVNWSSKILLIKTDSLGNITTNYISGNVFNDLNGNCIQDPGEKYVIGKSVELYPGPVYTTTDTNGHFSFSTDTGIFTVKPVVIKYMSQTCPASSYTVTLANYYDSSLTNNFADSVTISCADVSISVGTIGLRRCMKNTFSLSYCNEGTDTATNVFVYFFCPDTMIIPLSSSVPWVPIGSSVYQFGVGTLLPNQCGTIYITDSVSCNATLGIVKCVSAQIFPLSADCDSSDNSASDCHKVVSSFDPNDKQVVSQNNSVNGYVDGEIIAPTDTLTYRIRFQNTGTDTAFTIVILDTLSPYLDIASVKPGASSHNYSFRIYGQRILEWTFSNILLPDSGANQNASHGFVTFQARQMANNPNNTLIENSAAILFDFNSAVITNTSIDTVLILPGGMEENGLKNNSMIVYPNPCSSKAVVLFDQELHMAAFKIFNTLGECIYSDELKNVSRKEINLASEPDGVYFIEVKSDEKSLYGKIVKQ